MNCFLAVISFLNVRYSRLFIGFRYSIKQIFNNFNGTTPQTLRDSAEVV